MCFSASASFGAGVVLSVIGVASVKKARTSKEVLFASIPLIFAIQQITEGFLWLALTKPAFAGLQSITTYLFLFFAQVVWPIWVPYSIFKLHKEEKYEVAQKLLIVTGILVSVYLGYCLFTYHVEAKILGYHISYDQDYPSQLSRYGGILYVIATIVPPFISGIKKMRLLGVSILISYIITTIFYKDYIVSVWCFFSSLISIIVLFIMHRIRTSDNTAAQALSAN
ncbi:MAG: hypothetical protein Q8M29_16785 [Bacteroidota bacterium]|nr:hypothetical protein [Bacteroidota bacterium]